MPQPQSIPDPQASFLPRLKFSSLGQSCYAGCLLFLLPSTLGNDQDNSSICLCLHGNNITRAETYTQTRTPVSQSGRCRTVPLHPLFGFRSFVLNVGGSVLVACSVGAPENWPRSDSQH